MKEQLNKNKSILWSLLGHLSVFLFIFFSGIYEYRVKKSAPQLLPIYMHHAQINSTQQNVTFRQNMPLPKTIRLQDKIKRTAQSVHFTQSFRQKHFNLESKPTNNDQQEQKILTILHEAIAEKQSYPPNAQELNQSGTVRIQFLLYPDGHLAHTSLVQSSGFTSIDSAAYAAVNAISPIKEAGAYLHEAKIFSVDIIFE